MIDHHDGSQGCLRGSESEETVAKNEKYLQGLQRIPLMVSTAAACVNDIPTDTKNPSLHSGMKSRDPGQFLGGSGQSVVHVYANVI